MSRNNPNKKKTDLSPFLMAALKSSDLALPETEEEIAAAEEDIGVVDSLPESLRDPWGFLKPKSEWKPTHATLRPVPSEEIEAELARAARDGGELSVEVEEKMRLDRAKAEAEARTKDESED